MSTFERAKRNLVRDMASSRTHDAVSWANIMLRNTSRLTNIEDQHKFWDFMCNPYDDEDLPPCVIAPHEHQEPECPTSYKCGDVDMTSEYLVDGHALYVKTAPKIESEKSVALPIGQISLQSDSDDEKAFETS